MNDEARHVAFGVLPLKEFCNELTDAERFDTLGVTQFEDWADTGEEYLGPSGAVSPTTLAASGLPGR